MIKQIMLGLFTILAIALLLPTHAETMSPLKQYNSGTSSEDIQCNKELVLLIKNNGKPACVKDEHVFRLLQSGWAVKLIGEQNKVTIKNIPQIKTDTWRGQSSFSEEFGTPYSSAPMSSQSGGHLLEAPGTVGFAVGGAQDINNFRTNIDNNFLPLYTDITYEGLFYDYFFDTGKTRECEKLFCPSYSYAISKDPFSKNDDYYLSVGLNSGIQESDFQRKKLNLVIVMDVSGSMSSQFDSYYYDNIINGTIDPLANYDNSKSKMQLANESVIGLIDHLNDNDNLGIVLFDNNAYVAKPIENMAFTDKEKLQDNILQIQPDGGTNMESGMKLATTLFEEFKNIDSNEYENRIIFLTDAMPNLGNTTDEGLLGMITSNAKEKIYTTFIGIGVDFNTELAEKLTKARGSNYYSVHSASEFKNRMIDEFEFMVTPLVFNLLLNLDADGYNIKKIYGSPEADESTGQIMKINTLFPSKTIDGMTKGGIVLLKLEKISNDVSLTLETSYEDRLGKLDGDKVIVSIGNEESNYYENTGIQKAILLTRYADLMKNWVFDQRSILSDNNNIEEPLFYDKGLYVPHYIEPATLGQWERVSAPLQVSDVYKNLIREFNGYFSNEISLIGDDSLQQEMKILTKLEN